MYLRDHGISVEIDDLGEYISILSATDFDRALSRFELTLISDASNLASNDLIGRALNKNGALCWARLLAGSQEVPVDSKWSGEIEAASILGIRKPELIQTETWTDGEHTYRLLCTSLPESPAVSETPELSSDAAAITATWIAELQSYLERLRAVSTERVACAKDRILETIYDQWGVLFPIDEYCTAHGNLHWANVTAPLLSIVDWDNWGVAPYGYDVGFLLARSALVPRVSLLIETQFNDVLRSAEGKASVLFACAVMLRHLAKSDQPDALRPALEELASRHLM